jgi:Cupin
VLLETELGVSAGRLPFFINYGGDGPVSAKLVCGYLACDARPFNPLIENLPPVIKAGGPQDGDAGWLGQFIRVAVMESADKRAGGESVLAKLSELMFIEVVRRYLEALPSRHHRNTSRSERVRAGAQKSQLH